MFLSRFQAMIGLIALYGCCVLETVLVWRMQWPRYQEKLDLDLVGVAPAPVFSRFERLHDRMGGVLEVFGRVTIRGAVAATDMATRQAQTQVHPSGADFKAIFASFGARLYFVDLVQVRALGHGGLLERILQMSTKRSGILWSKSRNG